MNEMDKTTTALVEVKGGWMVSGCPYCGLKGSWELLPQQVETSEPSGSSITDGVLWVVGKQ